MTNDELNAALYQKMSAEFQNYRAYLLTLPPAEILDHTYEHTIKQDIVICAENGIFEREHVKALLRSSSPLEDVYQEYNKRDTQHMDSLRDCFEAEAKAAIRREQERRQTGPRKKGEAMR